MVQLLFWLGLGTILYTFLGYPVLVTLLSRYRPRPVAKQRITPSVTLLIPAHNEEQVIAAKIENSLALDYPPDKLRIVIAADGSDDQTVLIAGHFAEATVYHQPERKGKTAAVSRVMPEISSEIVVFTDANAMLDANALQAIVGNFADPEVGGVAGEKRVSGGGEGLYWTYESYLKRCDSRLSSVMGAAGELFAVRRDLYRDPAEDSLIEDFVMSMQLVWQGWRVVYEPGAVAYEEPLPTMTDEWHRRTRIGGGGFQAIIRLARLGRPRNLLVAWQYLSHRVLRWSVTPFLLPLTFLLNLALLTRPLYRFFLAGQTIFYALALLGFGQARRGRRRGLPYIIFYFCFTNLAVIVGFWRLITKRQPVTWKRTRQ